MERLDNGAKVGTGMKGGFCFFDTTAFNLSLPGAPTSAGLRARHRPRPEQPGRIESRHGDLRRLGDRYGSLLRDQYVDVTNLTSGNYRLSATADLAGQFTEASESNNTTWVDLKLQINDKGKGGGGSKARVIGYGPTP